jgi:hypothetical protein
MISGIRTALDVPVIWRITGEELLIFQGVMKGTDVEIQRDVAAFCSREKM